MKGWRLGAALAALILVGAVGSWLTYTLFTSRFPGGNDLIPRWIGGCALLREGLNPYSDEITRRSQISILGRLAEQPEDDRAYFAYPLYSVVFVWPLCLTENYALARAIWMWMLLGGLLAAAALWMRTIGWRPRLGLWTATMFWVVFMYHDFRALVLGQYAVWVLLALTAALWALRRERDGWAGFFLAFSTVKPQMVYLAIPWILLWAAGQRRWRVWLGLGGALAALTVGGMLLVPTWIADMIPQMFGYTSFAPTPALGWLLFHDLVGLGAAATVGVMVALALGLLAVSWRLWRGSWEEMTWMLGVWLLATNFFTPRIASTNYLTLLPWLLWGFCWMHRRGGKHGVWAILALQALLLVAPWVVFAATLEGNLETPPAFFPIPIVMIALLAWLWRRIGSRRGHVPG